MEVFLAERTRDEKNQKTLAVISKCRNAGTKVSPASALLRLVNCVSLASAFLHQNQSGNNGYILVRCGPAMSLCTP
jgi:hypothetical protein